MQLYIVSELLLITAAAKLAYFFENYSRLGQVSELIIKFNMLFFGKHFYSYTTDILVYCLYVSVIAEYLVFLQCVIFVPFLRNVRMKIYSNCGNQLIFSVS